MKKLLHYLLFAGIVICLPSCFEISEEVTINDDGSGTYVSIIDATKITEQMKLLAAMDTTGEMMPKLKYSLDSTFAVTIKKYASVNGVANVVADTSNPNVYKITMNFANVGALNTAISLVQNNKDLRNLYGWKKGQLTRKENILNLTKIEDESERELMKDMLEGMNYKIIMNLPGKIKESLNKDAKVSNDKKTLTLTYNLNEILNDVVSLANEVKYK